MRLLDLTLESPPANLALDEALLEAADANSDHPDVLRFWEISQPVVVLGRGSVAADEVDLEYCRSHAIPILRRCSGGAAIVAGPGCLMYSLVLNLARWPQLSAIDRAHQFILQRTAAALRGLRIPAEPQGISDLAVDDRKISGNSLRRKRSSILYHGTILYGLSPQLIQACLRTAPRQPTYRRNRTHEDFVALISATPAQLKQAMAVTWNADGTRPDWPESGMRTILPRYESDTWNRGR